MSQVKHNQEMELSDLQLQYQSLKEKLGQQEIVNSNLIHDMLHASISNFKRRNAEIILTYGLLAVTAFWSWYRLDLSLPFMIISLLLFSLIGLFEWYSCQRMMKIKIEDADVHTLVHKMEKASSRFSMLWITGVFVLCIWMMLFVSEIGEKLAMNDLRNSFIMIAAILSLTIILIICNIGRLAKLSDELLAQTYRRGDTATTPAYHRSGAYWTGVAMLALSLVGLVFKLMHWPFANLIYLSLILVGPLFVIMTGNHLKRVLPDERKVILIAVIAGLFLVIGLLFKLMHFPFSLLLVIIGLAFLFIAIFIHLLSHDSN